MGWYVHLHVSFACDDNDSVAVLAKKHLALIEAQETSDIGGGEIDGVWTRRAKQFLTALGERSGPNPGPKGGLSLWGMVINGNSVPDFVEVLRPFWRALLASGDDTGPMDFEHILVFYEEEQSDAAHAYEIFLDPDDKWSFDERFDPWSPDRELMIKHHGPLPFKWNQS